MAASKYTRSSRTSPCPVCRRTSDGDCRWNDEVILCHSYINQDAEISDYVYQGATSDGMWGQYFPLEQQQKETRPKNRKDYYYPDRNGNPLIKVTRVDDGLGHKQFYQSHWDGNQWVNGCPKEIRCRIPIYRYQEVREAIAQGKLIFMAEGEGVADDLWDIGIAATTTIGGSKKYRSYGNYTEDLAGAKLVLAPDCDRVGVEHMEEIAKDFPEAQWCYVIPDSFMWDRLPAKGGLDASDWIRNDRATIDQILAAVGEKRELAVSDERSDNQGVKNNGVKGCSLTTVGLEREVDNLISQGLPQSKLDALVPELAKRSCRQTRDVWQLYHTKLSLVEQQEQRQDTAFEVDTLSDATASQVDIGTVLPEQLAKPIKVLSNELNLRPEAYLTALLTAVSTLHKVGTKLVIHERWGFDVTPNLFSAIVSESSQKKSPILKEMVTKPLKQLQEKAEAEYKEATKEYDQEIEAWQKLSDEEKKETPEPEKPKLKLYYFNGATNEGIRERLQESPQQGVLALVDEVAALFKSANAYRNGRGSDEEDLLSYYDGEGQVVLRAKGKNGGIQSSVRDALIGILGGIQPDTLQALMKDCSDGNGKWARFMFVNQPLSKSSMPDDSGSLCLTPILTDLYEKIDNLPPTVYRLSKDALHYYRKVYNQLEEKRVTDCSQGMRTVWGKTEGRIGKIAVNLHVIFSVLRGETPGDLISKKVLVAATALAKFYAQQSQALHMNFASVGIAPHLAKIVGLSGLKGWLKSGDVQRAFTANKRPKADTVRSWFGELVEMGKGMIRGVGRAIEFCIGKATPPPDSPPRTPPPNSPPGMPPPGTPPQSPSPDFGSQLKIDENRQSVDGSSIAETTNNQGVGDENRQIDKIDDSSFSGSTVSQPAEVTTSTSTAVDKIDEIDPESISDATIHQPVAEAEVTTTTTAVDERVLEKSSICLLNGCNPEPVVNSAVDDLSILPSTFGESSIFDADGEATAPTTIEGGQQGTNLCPLAVGDRVKVIDAGNPHYEQQGTVGSIDSACRTPYQVDGDTFTEWFAGSQLRKLGGNDDAILVPNPNAPKLKLPAEDSGLKAGDAALSKTTGERVSIVEIFEKGGEPWAKFRYLESSCASFSGWGNEGETRLEFLAKADTA